MKEANKEILKRLSLISNEITGMLRIEFFFYTESMDQANNLAIELSKLNYKVWIADPDEEFNEYCVRGWTMPMKMNDEVLIDAWTDSMHELAKQNDCLFDGWGTTPDQKEEDFNS